MKSLKNLRLDGNLIKQLDVSIFETLAPLEAIDLSLNPWVCDRHAQKCKLHLHFLALEI